MHKKICYHVILDQSGSMQDCINPTISGFNEQLQVIKSLQKRFPEQEILVGLTRFNHQVMPAFSTQPPETVPFLTTEVYIPDGTTALYDAIGMTVLKLKEELALALK